MLTFAGREDLHEQNLQLEMAIPRYLLFFNFFCKLKVLSMLLENRKTPWTLNLQFIPYFELIPSFSDQ